MFLNNTIRIIYRTVQVQYSTGIYIMVDRMPLIDNNYGRIIRQAVKQCVRILLSLVSEYSTAE